jgi:transcriptional regulator with XRE-family HTH domain
MNILQAEIKRRLDEKDISISALERDANLKKGTLYNIVYGRSKNPRIDIMQAIARQLGCSVLELYGQESEVATTVEINNAAEGNTLPHENPRKTSKITEWNGKLYSECLQLVLERCAQQGFTTDKATMLSYIEEIYDYSIDSDTRQVDVRFAEWIFNKLFKGV